MQKVIEFAKRNWPITLILALTLILRLVKLEELFYFTYDESVFAFVGRRLILWHHVPLIGGVTPFGFHVAPYFYWFFALTLGLGKLNPVVWGYIAAVISIFTTFLMFKIGNSFLGKKVAFTAGIFWAVSFLAIAYDRHFWGLFFGPLFCLVVIYFMYQIINKKSGYIIPLGIVLALIIHADLSFYVFLIFTAACWIIFKLPINKKTFLSTILIISSFIPLIIFDIRHNFANTKPVLAFLDKGANKPGFTRSDLLEQANVFSGVTSRLFYTFGDSEIAKQYSYCRDFVEEKNRAVPAVFILSSWLILIGFTYWSLKTNKNIGWKLVTLLLGIYFVGLQVYGTVFRADIFEHYLAGALPLFLLILAKVVSLLPKKTWLIVISLFVFFNLQKLALSQNSHGLKNKRLAIEFTSSQVGKESFSLESTSTCWRFSGYRYLFAVFGQEPTKSYVDPNLGYLYGTTQIADEHPDTVVAFVTHDFKVETDDFYRRYALLKSHEKSSALFGNIEVIIMDNRTKWFDKVN